MQSESLGPHVERGRGLRKAAPWKEVKKMSPFEAITVSLLGLGVLCRALDIYLKWKTGSGSKS